MDIHIRRANLEDVPIIVKFTYMMMNDMANMGGRRLVEDFHAKASLAVRARDCLGEEKHLFILAENPESDPAPVGFTEASIITTEPFFIVSRILHIHAVYVLPSSRRVGIGRNLIQEAINWGRKQSCLEAQLNTLVWNPARSLYKKLGFQVREYRMSIDLVDTDGS